jgi:hypothetical protein
MPPCPSQLAYLPIFFFIKLLILKKLKSTIILFFVRKAKKPKTSSKTTIYVMTHTSIFEKKVAKQLQGKNKTWTKKFHSARRHEY